MFKNAHSNYALKKALKHELDKIGIARKGWDLESERSHHITHGSFEAVGIFDEAIKRREEINNENKKG